MFSLCSELNSKLQDTLEQIEVCQKGGKSMIPNVLPFRSQFRFSSKNFRPIISSPFEVLSRHMSMHIHASGPSEADVQCSSESYVCSVHSVAEI